MRFGPENSKKHSRRDRRIPADLTKPYHNLLELHKGKHRQTFYWDMNVSAMEDENRTLQYYLQDELKPLRVLYRSGSGAAYGYDEFGADLYDPKRNQAQEGSTADRENTSRLGLLGTGMMTSVGHTLRRRGNISQGWKIYGGGYPAGQKYHTKDAEPIWILR